MKICQIRQLKIGEGKPKICLPIVEKTTEDILKRIQSYEKYTYDVIELRIDFYENIHDEKQVLNLLQQIKKQTNRPLLLTYRSLREGGQLQLEDHEYIKLIETACQSHSVDMVDIELMSGNVLVCQLVKIAHQNDVKVIMSYHDFDQTPDVHEMKKHLECMEILGADIGKIAVMPHRYKDVVRLLEVTMEMSQRLNIPLVTMSMGEMGKISRISGELTGSAMTFASGGLSSAPGQIPVEKMNILLEAIHHD